MELSLSKEIWLKALRAVSGIIERKLQNLNPIYNNVLLVWQDGLLRFIANSREQELIYSVVLEDNSQGRALLAFRKLLDIVRSLADHSIIKLSIQADKVSISSGTSKFQILSFPVEDFIQPEAQVYQTGFSMPARNLLHILERLAFAMAEKDYRSYLNALFLKMHKQRLSIIAADGHRLFKFSKALPGPDFSLLLPKKAVHELIRLLRDLSTEVEFIFSEQAAGIKTKEIFFMAKTLACKYPDCDWILAAKGDKVLDLDKDAVRSILLRASVLLGENNERLNLNFAEHCLGFSAQNLENDAFYDELPLASSYDANIMLNCFYVLDFLNSVQAKSFKFSFKDATSMLFFEEDLADEELIYVLMQIEDLN